MPRAFAEDTVVPIAKTRAEIDDLLRAWKADGIRWTEDRAGGRFVEHYARNRDRVRERNRRYRERRGG